MKKLLAVLIVWLVIMGSVGAESYGWVMCQPDSQVNIRARPKRGSEVVCVGFCGDRLELDGKRKGPWVHVIVPCESGEGWIHSGYLAIDDEPDDVGSGIFITLKDKVNARACINGRIRKKLKKGTRLEVYLLTGEWSVTSEGFVKTEFLIEVSK